MKLPSYLRLTKSNSYVFRRRIPKKLLHYFKTNEIRINLGEVSRSLTIISSRTLALEAENLFYRLENNLNLSGTPSSLMINLKHKKELMGRDKRYEELENNLYQYAKSQSYIRQTNSERHKIEISLLSDIIKSTTIKPVKSLRKSLLLSDAINLYFEDSEVARRKDKFATVRKDKDAIRLFLMIVGDKDMSEINQSNAVHFSREAPTFGSRSKGERANNTVNGFMNSVNKFSSWVRAFHSEVGHEKLDFSRLRYKRTKKVSEERPRFTNDEVLRLLSHQKFNSFKFDDPAKYWLISIAAYSGARLEEISQLSPNTDVYQLDGVWTMDLNEMEDKSLKTDASTRKVPMHSKLIELGLLDYINELKDKKAKNLFPNEVIRDGRVGKNAGKRTNRYIQETVGIKGKSLHCFRHSVLTIFKNKVLEEGVAAAIVGHEHGGISYTRYGKEYDINRLKAAVELINFD